MRDKGSSSKLKVKEFKFGIKNFYFALAEGPVLL